MGRRKASEGTRTGFAGFLVGGGVLAGLQILQQVLGAFDPREVVTVLIAVAVALATTAAAKWRARTQRDAKLDRELRAWPLPLLKDAARPLGCGSPVRVVCFNGITRERRWS